MTLAEPIQVTNLVVAIFDELGIPYYIVGSLASSLYGIPRATADVDMIADIEPQRVPALIELLQKDFYVNRTLFVT
jgi:hypothetical protein